MPTKKLIEVALPLDDINIASAREKSIRHGHPLDAGRFLHYPSKTVNNWKQMD